MLLYHQHKSPQTGSLPDEAVSNIWNADADIDDERMQSLSLKSIA
jgi:hypothetical protein